MKNSDSDNIAVTLSVLQFSSRAILEHDFSCMYTDFISLWRSGLSLNSSVIDFSTTATSSSSKYCLLAIGTLYMIGRLAVGNPSDLTELAHIFNKIFVSITFSPPFLFNFWCFCLSRRVFP